MRPPDPPGPRLSAGMLLLGLVGCEIARREFQLMRPLLRVAITLFGIDWFMACGAVGSQAKSQPSVWMWAARRTDVTPSAMAGMKREARGSAPTSR